MTTINKIVCCSLLDEQLVLILSLYALIWQADELATFCRTLMATMSARRKGQDAHGNSRGTANAELQRHMGHIKMVGNLSHTAASSVPQHTQVSALKQAGEILARAKLVPASSVPPEWAVVEAVVFLRAQKDSNNKALLRAMWLAAKENAALRPYANFVIRLWLLLPAESVVESMGSVLKEVFSTKRQLRHENAAKELLVRWNGPPVAKAGGLVREVRSTYRHQFVRRDERMKHVLGRVLRKQTKKEYAFSIFL